MRSSIYVVERAGIKRREGSAYPARSPPLNGALDGDAYGSWRGVSEIPRCAEVVNEGLERRTVAVVGPVRSATRDRQQRRA